MGDISVIARRLSDKHVQYGWSGNGGYPGMVGAYLWDCYNTPEMVEYLFSLGQLELLCEPGSEKSRSIYRTTPTGEAHWVGTSEQEIYSKICFIDHAYFYDSDETWYYINIGTLHVKLPLETALCNIARNDILDNEFSLHLERKVFDEVQREWYTGNEQFREHAMKLGYNGQRMAALGQKLEQVDGSLFDYDNQELLESLRALYQFFDPWAVAVPDESRETIDTVILRPTSNPRIETIHWTRDKT